jgi:hypothetical protein
MILSEINNEEREKLARWHPWFAWKPVRVKFEKGTQRVWLEWLERSVYWEQGYKFERFRYPEKTSA